MHSLSEDTVEALNRVKNVISNREKLRNKGILEEKWIEAYLHTSCFKDIPFEDLKKMFDACDKETLKKISQEQRGHPYGDVHNSLQPLTIFRGCVGDAFRPGMSWTTDLSQAIKYPKRAKMYDWYGGDANQRCSVWVALVEKDELYCYLHHYEPEFIVCPQNYWKIDLPQEYFIYNISDEI